MIIVDGLTYRYPGAAAETLVALDFSLEDGEILGFLGPSGAGKSTTQKILIGLLRGYRGRVEVMGREVSAWGPDYYEQVGVCFELPNHYRRLTARENLAHFAALYRRETLAPDEVLEWVDLSASADQAVADFSKGMKVRLNLARSLIHRPSLLFLDEPTGGLDPVNARRVKALIRRLREEGTTVLLTTHDMMVADQLCDRVAFIVDGRIATLDGPEALKRRYGRREVEVTFERNGDRQHARFALDGLGTDEAFAALLREVRVETIHSQETTLENVFIEVTGQRLTQGQP